MASGLSVKHSLLVVVGLAFLRKADLP